MNESNTPTEYARNDLPAELPSIGEGDFVSIPVKQVDNNTKLQQSGDSDVTLILCGDLGEYDLTSESEYRLTGVVGKRIIGQGNSTNYLYLEMISKLSSVKSGVAPETGHSENQEDGLSDSPTTGGTGKSQPTAGVGKTVRKDGRGERISGKNPFADPNRIKDLGLHQGGN